MNEIKKEARKRQAQSIIKNLEKRNMEGYYYPTCEEATNAILSWIPDGASVTWGGSESIKECGLLDALKNGNYEVLDRSNARTNEEQRAYLQKAVGADYFFMSSNAVTLDGQLVNIDGNGNRVACLINGPKYVVLVVGMNKIVSDVESAVPRIRNIASPPNGVRLHTNTPCEITGKCGDCHAPGCMCSQIVITRHNRHTGRIKVVFVGEELGY